VQDGYLEKNAKAYKGKRGYEIQKLGQGRALRHNLRADDALKYYVSFAQAIEALQSEYQ
jgi:hypothetical protein